MVLLDSSVIVAAFRKDDPNFTLAHEQLKKYDNFIVPDLVLFETLTVLKMREGREIAAACGDFLQNNQNCNIRNTTNNEQQFVLIDFFQSKKLSFVDQLLAWLAKKDDIFLLTFDKDLKKYITKL